MSLKTLILTVVVAILIGAGIFLITNPSSNNLTIATPSFKKLPPQTDTQTPQPTLLPINEHTDLKQEIKNLTPRDFANDFKNLTF